MHLTDTPDVYGYTIFCDDIRQEVNGARTFVGVYTGAITLPSFPITLPKFSFALSFLQRKRVFNPNVAIRIFLPGDSDDNATIQGEFAGESADKLAEAAIATAQAETDDETPGYLTLHGFIFVAPFQLKSTGSIKVRAIVGDKMHRLGALRILQQPSVEATTEQPSH